MSKARVSITPADAWSDPELTHLQCRVLGLIGAYLGKDSRAWPSQKRLAEELNCSRKSIIEATKILADRGYISVEKRVREDGGQTSNSYLVLMDPCNRRVTPPVTPASHPLSPLEVTPPVTSGGDTLKKDTNERHKIREKEEKHIFDHYNQIAERVGWVKHSKLTDAYRKAIRARVNDHSVSEVISFLNALAKQDWTFKGFAGNDKFRVSLMYAMRPRTFAEHFDKLTQPAGTGTAPVGDTAKRDKLDWLFERFAKTSEWMGERYGFQFRPDDPRSDYPAEVYARHNLTKPQVAA